jgi:hypothetical protein
MPTLADAEEVLPVDELEDLDTLGTVDVSDREVKMGEMLVESLTAAARARSRPSAPSTSRARHSPSRRRASAIRSRVS